MKTMVVISAYNEALTVREVVQRALIQKKPVIVINDGSTDETVTAIEDLDITLLHQAKNTGKAACIWRGVEYAISQGADAIITLDADLQHRPEHIPELLEQSEKHPGNIIIASRTRGRHAVPWIRDFANRSANFWISWAAGFSMPDTQSGFRLYPAEVFIDATVGHGDGRNFVLESEILIESAQKGIYVVPVEIDALYDVCMRASYYRPVQDTFKIVCMVAGRLLKKGFYPRGLLQSLGIVKPKVKKRGSKVDL